MTSPQSDIVSSNTIPEDIYPFLFGFTAAVQPTPETDQENGEINRPPIAGERFVMINPFANSLVIIPDPVMVNIGTLFSQVTSKNDHPPASKASIEAMPVVNVSEEEEGSECSICLTDYVIGGVAKEMGCKHRFHPGCIERWLEINGSCPVCRYTVPTGLGRVDGGEDEGGRRAGAGGGGGITITFHFGGRRGEELDTGHGENGSVMV
ncbi:E3 ubiquitin-protein ligase MPSR1-like [Impatiens glandulifera]|uniref:E3 ubiquitin-protein ligase MPSR1-like n=1 Tax=Impatiens glandulifera TaxID=253017 RepID=UPI001FB1A019|nr:E3 ubiquitin-protein ligase MPSR1-like [Impatiens glandulifera]